MMDPDPPPYRGRPYRVELVTVCSALARTLFRRWGT